MKMKTIIKENKESKFVKTHESIVNQIDAFIKECQLAIQKTDVAYIRNRLENLILSYKDIRRAITNNDPTIISTSNTVYDTDYDVHKDRYR